MNGSLPAVGHRPYLIGSYPSGIWAFVNLFIQKSKIYLTCLCTIVQSRPVERWLHRTTSSSQLTIYENSSLVYPSKFGSVILANHTRGITGYRGRRPGLYCG